MTNDKTSELINDINSISIHFEEKPSNNNFKDVKESFNLKSTDTPTHYWQVKEELEEILRQTRFLYLHAVFNKICKVDGEFYEFDVPFESAMKYYGVVKQNDTFYLKDEDGDFRDIFHGEDFANFIQELYWEIYE